VRDGKTVSALKQGESGAVILNQTPFYAESGGQVGDTGMMIGEGVRFTVTDTQKRAGDLYVHLGKVERGTLKVGAPLSLDVDHERRGAIRKNHSATHLLHEALRQVLGDHVAQKGSLVAPDRLRFDFSHPKPMSAGEIERIEEIANDVVLQNAPVITRLLGRDDAIASGARENGVASFYIRKCDKPARVAFSGRVLVVEDNPVNQDVATGILENMGCTVATAPNGYAAVQRCAQDAFDLILMDCEMPIMDGFDATRRIRDIERVMRGLSDRESRSRTPIVALTAHALAEVRERCLEVGMDDFLVKPYDELQIADMLGRWLTPRSAIMGAPDSNSPNREESLPSAVSTARLDMKAVERIRRISGDDGSSLLGQVVSQFAATSAPLLQTLRAKSRDSDPQAVWRAAHSLRSSASAIGARRVSQYCEEIEMSARDNGILPAEALLAELESEVAAATVDLSALVRAEQGAA